MQTFLPYADFNKSAEVLDMKRLGKQRVETLQIVKALLTPSYGWQNHPAVKMWRGHEWYLYLYQNAICNEWTSRGYKDTCLDKTLIAMAGQPIGIKKPEWLGREDIHQSHRSNLTRKMPEWYSEFWEEPDDIPYVWPGEILV
jgi:hypothetical protein